MATLLSAIGSIFAAALGWCGDVVGLITKQTVAGTFDYPLLILFTVIGLVGLGIGIYQRLIRG